MAKSRIKIDELAKLRQFKKGDNVDDFLSTQFRQVVRAIEQAYVRTSDSTTSPPPDLSAYPTTAQMNTAIANAIATTNPVWAVYRPVTLLTSGDIQISLGRGNAGSTPGGYQFKPNNFGLYWIEMNGYWSRITPPIGDATYTSTLECRVIDGPILELITYQHYVAGFTDGISINQTQSGFYAELAASSSIRFNLNLSYAALSKFNVKITRIADYY